MSRRLTTPIGDRRRMTEQAMKAKRSRRVRVLAMMEGRGRSGASALDIAKTMGSCREAAGLAEGVRLVGEGLAVATRGNLFMLAKYEGKSVPPAFEVDNIGRRAFRRQSFPQP
jgi:hypothetical protein